MDEDYISCPYCAEEIKKEAKKCKHCGEWLEDRGISNKGKIKGKKEKANAQCPNCGSFKTENRGGAINRFFAGTLASFALLL